MTAEQTSSPTKGQTSMPMNWSTVFIVLSFVFALLLSVVLANPALAGLPGASSQANASPSQSSPTQESGGTQEHNIAPTGKNTRVNISIEGMSFTPNLVKVPAGNTLTLVVTNNDQMAHDLMLESGKTTGHIQPGQTATLQAGVVSGNLEGWCTLPGHREMGMTMQIVATGAKGGSKRAKTGGSQGEASAGTGSSGAHMHGDEGAAAKPGIADFMKDPSPVRFDPTAPKTPRGKVHRYTFTVTEGSIDMGAGLRRDIWTFNGGPTGPTLRGKVGDTFEITLVNKGSMSHSIDFHASEVSPDIYMREVAVGKKLVYRFKARRSGIWLYHCSSMPMSLHIAAGMHGAVIIDPPGLSKVDHEYVFVQSEIYPNRNGGPDPRAVNDFRPDYIAFNGLPFQYRSKPIKVKVGEKVRVWVMAAGPNFGTSFHIVGGQFDTVWKEGRYIVRNGKVPGQPRDLRPHTGSQAMWLAAAQGGFVELSFKEPGHYTFVDHQMVRSEQGANGQFEVTK